MKNLVVYSFSLLLLLTVTHTNTEGKCIPSKRNMHERYLFMKQTGYPHGRKGYIIDHITPLCAGGIDKVYNMQWQTVEESYEKDIKERAFCHRLWNE